jgi:hypothetical protein
MPLLRRNGRDAHLKPQLAKISAWRTLSACHVGTRVDASSVFFVVHPCRYPVVQAKWTGSKKPDDIGASGMGKVDRPQKAMGCHTTGHFRTRR